MPTAADPISQSIRLSDPRVRLRKPSIPGLSIRMIRRKRIRMPPNMPAISGAMERKQERLTGLASANQPKISEDRLRITGQGTDLIPVECLAERLSERRATALNGWIPPNWATKRKPFRKAG